MIADKLTNLKKYADFAEYAEEILAFVRQDREAQLADGRYDLRGEELFALVQSYETKPKCAGRIEGHEKYSDLQYIVSGEEYIYWASTEDLEIEEDRRPEADILFYRGGEPQCRSLLAAGMFGFYMPSDGHMPCVASGACAPVRKIVFKLRYRG